MNKKKIILVEDEVTSSASISKKLAGFGYEVISVTTGEDVVKNVETLQPDLILMDINLAGKMDGIEAASIIQEKTDVPVVYITGLNNEEVLQRALNTSPYSYLSKPVSDFELNNAIEIALHRHNLEKVLKKHEKWLEALIKNIDDAVIITDNKGIITYLNAVAEKLTGRELDEVLGNSHTELLNLCNEKNGKSVESPVLSAIQHSITINLQPDTYIISRDGTQTFISGKAIPFRDDNGKLSGVILIIKEISERIHDNGNSKNDLEKKIIERTAELMEENVGRKKAEESLHTSEEKYRTIVETSFEGIWLSDNNFKTTFVNRRMADMLGYSMEELLSTQLTEHLDGKHKNLFLQEFDAKSVISGDVRELLFNRKDGSGLWALVSTNILLDDSGIPIGMLSMINDITERKHAEKEIIKARLKAEESSRLKSILIMNLNHELRTPMNGILGFASLLKDEITDAEQAEMMNDIYASGNRLMQILNSIMEFAMLESGHSKPKLEEINLCLNIQPVIEDYRNKAKEKGLSYIYKIENDNIFVNTDNDMLKTLISNIIDNAIKYTEKGGVIIEINKIEDRKNAYALLSVCDTGIGIPEDKKNEIFEEFKQASEGYGRSHEGIGLGLSIAKRISDLLDIQISLESTNANGTIFTIKIPVVGSALPADETSGQTEPEDSAHISDDKGKAGNFKEILLVEDNKTNINLIIYFLKKNFKISFASTGEKAIEMAEEKIYSLILTDINLGTGIDGIETQKRIRKINGYRNIPNIAVTGYSTAEDKRRFLDEGFDDFISKPFTKEILVQKIEHYINSKIS